MFLHTKLEDRKNPIRVAFVGCGKFVSMFLAQYNELKKIKIGEKLDGEGGFCARGRLITSEKSKKEMILPLGLSDKAIVKKNIKKDHIIKLEDVQLDLPKEVLVARGYQYNLI